MIDRKIRVYIARGEGLSRSERGADAGVEGLLSLRD